MSLSDKLPLLLLAYCFCLLTHAASGGGNETDRLALLAFKAQITDDPLGVLSSWNDSIHFCQWQGVTCSKRHPSRVSELRLRGQQLTGSLSPHIGNLSFLQLVELLENNLVNEIPQEVGKLLRLKWLVLQNNSFHGQIPGNISHCRNLVFLGLGWNELSGSIPPELGLLQNLQALIIHGNSLSGPIPPSLGNLSSLGSLSAATNQLEGSIPATFGQLKSLYFLGLGSNNLSGSLPPSIYNLSSITTFSVRGNQIHGTFPPDMGVLFPKLEVFNIESNLFTGQIPKSISNCSDMVRLQLNINHLTGGVPSFSRMLKLNRLLLSDNILGEGKDKDLDFFSELVNSKSLEIVTLEACNLVGVLPESLSNFSTMLRVLILGNNKIRGAIPAGIGNLINLTVLDLSKNKLTGAIPSSLSILQKLGKLRLHHNKLSGPIPSSLGTVGSLVTLLLTGNNLEGVIPSSLGGLQNLNFLGLGQNNLSGTIPKEVMFISSLSYVLDLSGNQLTGHLPFEVGKLSMLSILDVSRNKLSGQIPATLGTCTSLQSLYMNENFFQGTIPQSFSSLRALDNLDLSSNNLSGQIPSFLESFVFLKHLNLSYNDFGGKIPTQGVFMNVTAISIIGNEKLCGGTPQLHLPGCISKSRKLGLSLKLKLVISILGGLVVVASVAASLFYVFFRKRKQVISSESYFDDFLMRLSFESLLKATNGFSPDNIIGKGSFGSVYKGILEGTETVVAVKVLNLQFKAAFKSFMAECQTLRGIRHRNLVKVLTACSSIDFQNNDFKALVYEYMSNGSLEEWLHPIARAHGEDEETKSLSLSERLDIAIGVASALNYLHHECETSIVHCDLKPSNILLDKDMTARVGDFGLARFLQEAKQGSSSDQCSTLGIKGSIGYVAPEYGMGSEVSKQGDVYSFGILLLEMFTGKRPTDNMFKDGLNLHEFTVSSLPDRVEEIVDPMLLVPEENEEMNMIVHPNRSQARCPKIEECLAAVLGVGVSCSNESPSDRMDISNVLVTLHHMKEALVGPRPH